jgi:diguanylate cyclase (GGDEF)-like protein
MIAGGRTKVDFTLSLAVLAAVVIGLLLFVMVMLVDQFDISAQAREENIVRHGVAARVHEVASTVLPQVMWDDAVLNLDNRFNRKWASENLGTYLNKTAGFDMTFALDPEERPIFAASGSADAALFTYEGFRHAFASLIAQVRRAERHRGPLPSKIGLNAVLAPPIQASAIAAVNGNVYIVVATLVTPDFGRFRPMRQRAPIVVTAMLIDQNLLDGLASRFLLDGVHLHGGDSAIEIDKSHAPMLDASGRQVATLDWIPQKPGHALLSRLGLPIMSVGSFLFAALILFYRRSRTAAKGLIASEARATHLAFHDTLTGLPNRILFRSRLEHALAQIDRSDGLVVVHCMDLDRFKEINDTLGHQVGDELIRAAAARMAAQCRVSETFARLSGDEFAIVQSNVTIAAAATLAARLCEIMMQPFELSSGRVFVSCSIGMACTADSHADPAELFRQADLALYRVKSEGRGQFRIFEAEMDAVIKSRRSLEADLRDALDAGQLRLAYQPQVDGRDRMTGVEALLRWRHPTRGDVSPAYFIPVAEQSSLISAIGMFTLRRAFEDSRRWKGLRIGINVSANQIRMKDFVPGLAGLVAEMAVDPANFELEITEGVLLRDDPETHDTLSALKALGFGLALDDFGTGYSSLSYLRRYPISKIKIDRSFIISIGVERDSEEVVRAIVKLARALKLAVIAEGVETNEQRHWLKASGCLAVQGYLFGKAMSAEDVDALWDNPNHVLAPIGTISQASTQ